MATARDHGRGERRSAPRVRRIEPDGSRGTRRGVAPIALGPGSGLAAVRDLSALTRGTGTGQTYHGRPPVKRASAGHAEP
jgi:hypothetical protein